MMMLILFVILESLVVHLWCKGRAFEKELAAEDRRRRQ